MSSQNYILSRRMLDASGSGRLENITYYTGHGRPFHTVSKAMQAETVKERTATLLEYDGKGRATVSWLPTPVTEDYTAPSSFKSRAKGTTGYNDTYPCETTVYENSPLDRVWLQYGAGVAWNSSHPVTTHYLTNSASGDLSCKKYTTDGTTLSGGTATHAAGTLYVTQTTDEDGNIGYVFTDGEERILLERRMNGTEQLDTYYVYDDYGHLCFVLQLMYQTTANVSLYAFQYRYNNRGLCIWKKLPGAEHILYEYDGADRLVFSQDGVQRTGGKWTFYVYDNLNRLVQQGENTSKAVSASGVYLQNYYDNYTSFREALPVSERSQYPDDTSGYSKGSLTGTVMNVFGSGEKIYTAYYYDAKGRVRKTIENNLLGGYNTTETTYTFTDQPATVTLTHTANGKATQTEVYTYTYDHSDRISSVTHKLNSGSTVTLASYTYDNKGRMATKTLHGSSSNQLTYAYNIRSWLTGISSSKFTQTLGYGSHYNGNISTMNWNANGSNHSYAFTYDGVNRMLNATHGTGAYTEKVTGYDKNGNITGLQRYNSSLVDNLTYIYNGNQLTKVEDATGNTAGFKNGASQANEYTYDNNGNLTKDLNKGITNISYNVLSLPQVVTFSNGSTITYLYTTDGKKLRTIHVVNGTTTTTDYSGNVIYENGTQKLLLTEEGYVDLVNSNTYYYYLKDHQGNNRVVISSSGTVMETNHYYPFGGVFSTSSSVQPYKYNGKELDTKKGLNWYDYGARHYDAVLGRWHGVDRQAEKYYSISPYAFTGNHTFNTLELGGELFIFVNGFYPMEYFGHYAYHTQRNSSSPYSPVPIYNPDRSFKNTDSYGWANIDKLYMKQYDDMNSLYVNGSFDLTSSASTRYNRGIESGKELLRKLRSGAYLLGEEETIKIVGYSMGGAYAAGMAHTIMQDSEYANLLQFVDYLAPYQPTGFEHPDGVLGRQFVSSKDRIATNQSVKNIKFSFVQDFGDIYNLFGHSLSDDMHQFLKQCFDNEVPIQIGY